MKTLHEAILAALDACYEADTQPGRPTTGWLATNVEIAVEAWLDAREVATPPPRCARCNGYGMIPLAPARPDEPCSCPAGARYR